MNTKDSEGSDLTEIAELSGFAESVRSDAEELSDRSKLCEAAPSHRSALKRILNAMQPVDLKAASGLEVDEKLRQRHYRIIISEEVTRIAKDLGFSFLLDQGQVHLFNREFWKPLDRRTLTRFLKRVAVRMGIDRFLVGDYEFLEKLYKQFLNDAELRSESEQDVVAINLKNGTFKVGNGKHGIYAFDKEDFLCYQLDFAFDPDAECPLFDSFLQQVQPNLENRQLLAEFFGTVFLRRKTEKVLLLLGGGANGKSVLCDIVCAMLGSENVTNCSLESLNDPYYRAMLSNKLLNYSPELSSRLNPEKFKILASGEPIEARLPYQEPITLRNYARLAFNCNELPRDVEHTDAFFRRLLIVPFDVQIPECDRDPDLAKRIIDSELPGVFRWVLTGLERLIEQGTFTVSESSKATLKEYRLESDSVALFLHEENYQSDPSSRIPVKDIFASYTNYCIQSNMKPLGRTNFARRLTRNGIQTVRVGAGRIAYISKRRTN